MSVPAPAGRRWAAAVTAVAGPARPDGKSEAWETIAVQAEQIQAWLDGGSTLTRVHTLLRRRGVVVAYRTLVRYATEELGFRRRRATLPRDYGEPGVEVLAVLGRLGMLTDESDERRRVVHGLIFTAVHSRHMFVYPTYGQTLIDVVVGFEAAWAFFGGVFAVVVPDIEAIVDRAPATAPQLNPLFGEYAHVRGFTVDLPCVTTALDRPRIARSVSYVRSSFFAGEHFQNLDECREQAAHWSAAVAGMRMHSGTGGRPAEVFATEEQPHLSPPPDEVFDFPTWTHPKVAADGHARVAKAFYSVPGELVGQRLDARLDARAVKLYWRGELIKVHPVVAPGRWSTDPADPPPFSLREVSRERADAPRISLHDPVDDLGP
ncbi:hypothetical protein AO501_29095 [Mycobacterium gordonae]|uniref:Integrase catalytic domain-containing protein n=1 Tax=Mycobacterium gordonae TaxID=1778 RepID=A0A0Q2LK80_MYCGO|nr:transposase [Mycobacterium gordonae]KQH76282.1 hypothetical protein AO501_29095 [Mycobacterium gordonae]